jgi:drug/metabolite transporter (DMT)-like permease
LILAIISLTNTFSYFFAFKNTTIANAVLTHYTAPVIVAFLAPFFLKEKLTVKILLSIAIASTGLWIMLNISPEQFMSLLLAGDANTIGIFSGLFSGFAYAVLIIVIRALAQSFNPFIMTLFLNLIIASILLPFIQIPEDFTSALWAFAVMGVVHSTIAPVLYFRGMKEVTANRAAIIGYLEPVCAILLGLIFLSEAVNLSTIIGGLMILYSGYITIRS